MSCSIFNSVPFQAATFPHEWRAGEVVQILVVKGTWSLSSGRMAPPHRQVPIHPIDETVTLENLTLEPVQRQFLAGREKDTWLRYESDLTPPKPQFDLIVNAWVQHKEQRFHQMPFSVDLNGQRLLHQVALAPRIWSHGVLGPVIKEAAAPVSKVPAFNVFAFGGPANRSAIATRNAERPTGVGSWPANQDGMGYCTEAILAAGVALPWLEMPDHRISQWHDRPLTAALGHVSRADQPRQALQGTSDDRGKLPADFDRRSFNAAPTSLQLARSPKPGDRVTLSNLSRDGHCTFAFPQLTLWAMGEKRAGQRVSPVQLLWDTLLLEPEADRASIVWRAAIEDPEGSLASITLSTEPGVMI